MTLTTIFANEFQGYHEGMSLSGPFTDQGMRNS